MRDHQKSHLKKSLIILGVTLGAVLGSAAHVAASPRHTLPPSQANAPADINAAANDAYQTKDWGSASRLYAQITAQQPGNGRAWYRLGVALDGQGQQDEAVAAFQKSIQAGVPAGIGEYGIALSYGSRQNNERAFEYLEKAAQDGFSDSARLAADVELASLRSDSRFAKVAEQVKRNAKPCAYNPLNRQFDFWVGEWDVVTAEGANPAGTSKIELILGDCVIQENWTSGGNTGYEGKELQHLQSRPAPLGTILERQRRGHDSFLRRTEKRSDGLLDGRHSAKRWDEIKAPPAIHSVGRR